MTEEMLQASTAAQRRFEFVAILTALLQGQTPSTLAPHQKIDELLNLAESVQKRIDVKMGAAQ